MRALVVYESMFGNTQTIAKAVAAGLTPHAEVDLLEVGSAPAEVGDDVALLVVGGPTHAFGMTRASTRADAAKQATEGLVSKGDGIREWLDGLRLPHHMRVAAFDTKVSKPKLPGSAAHAAHRQLRKLGGDPATKAETFYVEGTTGPLTEGETDRARRWGEQLAAHLA